MTKADKDERRLKERDLQRMGFDSLALELCWRLNDAEYEQVVAVISRVSYAQAEERGLA